MLHKISKAMAKKLAMSSEPEKEEIYVYGLELIITTFLGLASIVLVSGVFSEWSSAWIFRSAETLYRRVSCRYLWKMFCDQ